MKTATVSSFDPFCATPYYLAFDNLPDDLQALDRYLLHVLVSFAGLGWVHASRTESLTVSPGLKHLAGRSRLDGRTVQRTLNRLADRRLILIVDGAAGQHASRNNTYIVTPKAFVLHAEKLALAASDDFGPEDRLIELQRIGAVSNRVLRSLAKLSRLPGRTTWEELDRYQRLFEELKHRILEFENRSGVLEDLAMKSADLNHDSEPGGGMGQSPAIKILKNPDLKFSEILSNTSNSELKFSEIVRNTRYVKYPRSILILSFKINNKKINKHGWMVSKSARACEVEKSSDPVNRKSYADSKITPQVVSIAKDLETTFFSPSGFLDFKLLNQWVSNLIAQKGWEYVITFTEWTHQLWESRGRRPFRLSPASLKTLAQMYESEQIALRREKNIAASFDDHRYSRDKLNGENLPRCEVTKKNIITESRTISEETSDLIHKLS